MASSLTKAGTGTTGERTFFGHPRGLATLFMTEMWERFSFYGMRALLVLYLTAQVADGGLAMKASTATALYAVYNATVYLLALPGGWFGDRVWGPRKTTAIAGGIIMTGHFLLAVPFKASFFVGLVFIAAGSGLLKSNISTMVGHLYDGPNDPRRDGGFTIFYMGINIGAFLAPLVIGTVGQKVNWHLGFAMAGVGMGLGLIQFLVGTRSLSARSSLVPSPLSADEKSAAVRKTLIGVAIAAVFYGTITLAGIFSIDWVLWPMSIAGIALPALYFARIRRDQDVTPDERKKMTGFIWFFIAAALFWLIFDQSGSTLTVFAKESTASTLFGFAFPESWFQSLNPLYVMALAPVIAALWVKLGRRNPTTTTKFGLGLTGIGLSFGVMMLAMGVAAATDDRVSPLWLASVYLIMTVAELCLSPVGLSVSTKLAPEKYSSQVMGLWFLAVTAGNCLASIMALIFGEKTGSPVYFGVIGALAVVAGIAFLLNRKKIIRLMGDVH
ncbi:MFS transporter [Streptomyces sp. RKND-216]|uniref:peptide MFS transporter n=1 Tax=Streptomyces sp. RKND-216 TaxID=2562581 RepID=UPI00109DCE25|nr:oligopeptide:H+ symporter [Streptomyces sp. RKND-216]THA26085.1 MFS transporter [Streptomyces sp. RKND-216]